jgi:hypothetical protein
MSAQRTIHQLSRRELERELALMLDAPAGRVRDAISELSFLDLKRAVKKGLNGELGAYGRSEWRS